MPNREKQFFDPGSIRDALHTNFTDALRAIADAIDAGDIEGRLYDCQGNGFTRVDDPRAHIIVKLDLAADVIRWVDRFPAPALPQPTLALPAPDTAIRPMQIERGQTQ